MPENWLVIWRVDAISPTILPPQNPWNSVTIWGEVADARKVKRSVALAVSGVDGGSRVILVRRPMDDVEFPGMWGLPAASCHNGETPEQAAERVGVQKLGVALVLGGVLAQGEQQRPGYHLEMTLYQARLVASPSWSAPLLVSGWPQQVTPS